MTRVLIADDQAEVRAALAALVRSDRELEIVGLAEDADEAVRLSAEHRPDVALIDFNMPGGGPYAVRGIRVSSPSTRIVALSAYDDRETVFDMLRAGAVGYVVKGASATEILETIRRSSRGEAVLSGYVATGVVDELRERLETQASAEQLERMRAARIRRVLELRGPLIVFQPIVSLADGGVVGYEALSRFPPEPVRPTEAWFAEADSVDLLLELELAALRAALRGLPLLPEHVFLAVNLSPEVLLEPAVHDELANAPVERLVVEVTEHARVADYDALTEALLDLRSRGGRLAVDDAGAGFSLNHVLKLSPDLVKIDGSIIHSFESHRPSRALTKALVSFAAELGQLVVAEQVETSKSVDALRALGVQYGQGFHLGHPAELPALR